MLPIDNAYVIKDCICGWYDLLGYGKPFVDSKWNLNDMRCYNNFERIKKLKLYFSVSLAAKVLGTKLSFNDGFASTMDVILTSEANYNDVLLFLEGIINDFIAINNSDQLNGFPGVRGIITFGQRFSYDDYNTSFDVSAERTFAYSPTEFQMNTAFSKAFIMEESGSRANLCGNSLFIDLELFNVLKEYAKVLGYQTPKVEKGDTGLNISFFYKNGWFADISMDQTEYPYGKSDKYNNRGIETTLFRFISIRSIIDEYANEAQRLQSYRYSLITDEEE